MTVSPASVVLAPLGQRKFYASVSGLSNDSVRWEVVGGDANGAITVDGQYTAPGNVGFFEVRARSVADPTVTGLARVMVAIGGPIEDIEIITGTVRIQIDDFISTNFSNGPGLDYRSDEYWKQDVTYSGLVLHGAIGDSSGYYWNSHRRDTMNVTGSFSQRDEWIGDPSGKLVMRDDVVAETQTKNVEGYFRFTIDTATRTGTIDFDGVDLRALKNWRDFESGEHEDDTPLEVRTLGCKLSKIPISVTPNGHITGRKSGVPILTYRNPDLFIEATVTWDFDITP